MLSSKHEKLLKFITQIIEDDNVYKVIDKVDFLVKFKKRQKVNQDVLTDMMRELEKHDFISIKYIDSEVYCFAVQKQGRLYFEKHFSENKEIQKLRKIFFFYTILAGVASFVGATLAIFIFLGR